MKMSPKMRSSDRLNGDIKQELPVTKTILHQHQFRMSKSGQFLHSAIRKKNSLMNQSPSSMKMGSQELVSPSNNSRDESPQQQDRFVNLIPITSS
mmetsp:Transcript_35559/g.54356  ORF Transcript_35559/g.54356 Transcript_35559/m.54356 type:complete len:95 (+) Transcript_35559:763-1047(+)